ncbi:hypothetical protein ACTHPF_05255 [Paenibacillus sp. SAF-054]|uniref:hypothetical protein n=1 Tax=Paenibacillus sp. SAF-054 TaxID=3436863 RepID=UPI003F7CFF42
MLDYHQTISKLLWLFFVYLVLGLSLEIHEHKNDHTCGAAPPSLKVICFKDSKTTAESVTQAGGKIFVICKYMRIKNYPNIGLQQ